VALRNRLAGCSAALALITAGTACAQVDPMGALYGAPVNGPATNGAQNGRQDGGRQGSARSSGGAIMGVQSVSGAVGASYAGSQEKGATSLAQIAMLPKTVQPFTVVLDGSSEKYLRNRPKIAIPAYALGLQRDSSITASAAGKGSDITPRRTTITSHLAGVSDELGAQLAQEAYDDLVGKLTTAGFEVVTPEQAAAAPHIQSLGRYGGPLRVKEGWTVYAPAGAPLIKGYAFETGMASLAASGSLIGMGKASQELDAVIITPQLMLNHIGMGGTGQRNYVGSASVEARLHFVLTQQSIVPFIWGNDRGGAMPGVFRVKPSGTDEMFGVLVQTEDRSDDAGLTNAFADAGMGSVYRQSLVYAVEADPGRFAALCRAAFQGFNAALVDQIRRARAS
jgi:hypothetical protein